MCCRPVRSLHVTIFYSCITLLDIYVFFKICFKALKHVNVRTGRQNEILQHFDTIPQYQCCDSEGMTAGEVVGEAHQCGEFRK